MNSLLCGSRTQAKSGQCLRGVPSGASGDRCPISAAKLPQEIPHHPLARRFQTREYFDKPIKICQGHSTAASYLKFLPRLTSRFHAKALTELESSFHQRSDLSPMEISNFCSGFLESLRMTDPYSVLHASATRTVELRSFSWVDISNDMIDLFRGTRFRHMDPIENLLHLSLAHVSGFTSLL